MSYANDMPTVEMASRTDAGLASELRLSVMRLRRRLANERHPDNPLSMGAMAVLGCLFRNGDLTVGELATQERVQPPSMTRTVNALESAGYVTRRAHETDGRQVVVSLSDPGRTTLLADRARRDAWLAQRLRYLDPEERETLRRAAPILERLATTD
jgi:DNA-binding MarR family transcriptional regulator